MRDKAQTHFRPLDLVLGWTSQHSRARAFVKMQVGQDTF